MASYDYDLFVIGAGSGGVRAARISAGFGARVAIAEDRYYGGTCVNVGCVPKKLFVYASHIAEEIEDAAGFGWQASAQNFDWQTLVANKNTEIARLNSVYERLLINAGVDIIDGRASIVDPHTVSVAGRRVTAERILVATGGWPTVPDFPGSEHAITSNDVFYLDQLPEKMIILGGGYIAVEFASIFNGLGVDTTLVYRGPLFLRGFDADVREFVAEEMDKKGVNLLFDNNISAIEKASDGLHVTFTNSPNQVVDTVMVATGRAPKIDGLGLEDLGVELAWNGAVVVDDQFRTSVRSIHAIGDVTNRVNLTPVATAEGMALANALFNDRPVDMDYNNIPTAVFCQPNIGTVGLTEEQAREKYPDDIDIYRSSFRALKHTLSGRDEKTLMKLVVVRDSDKVVGLHMVGPEAGEITQGFAVAIKAGATKAVFDATVGIHPTAAEEFVTMRQPIP